MSFADEVQGDGFAIVEDVLDLTSISRLATLLESVAETAKGQGGVRNLLDLVEMRELAYSTPMIGLVTPILGDGAFAVRGILFEKKDGANWKVPWHQDVTIAVKNRAEVENYGPWSVKQDVLHVQPPSAVLEKMVSVRLHLDDCPLSNGALRVIPGSHTQGKLSQEAIAEFAKNEKPIACEVRRGGALLMRPLTIHASSAAETPQHRRVIHFDYANIALAGELQWREDIPENNAVRASRE